MNNSRKLLLVAVALMFAAATTLRAWANPETTVSISPSEVGNLSTGQTFTVDVVIADVSNLYGWQIKVIFDPNVLNANRVNEGPFLMNVNDTAWPKPVIDNTVGYVLASALLMPPYPPVGVTGSGTLANVTFSVKSGGSSALHFDETVTYLRSVVSGVVVPIENFVTHDGTYGGGGGGTFGIPFELIAGVAVAVVIVVVAGVLFLRRRKT